MNKLEQKMIRGAAFVLSTVISASILGLFSSWAWNYLDPAQQEIVAAAAAPLDFASAEHLLASIVAPRWVRAETQQANNR